MLSAPSLAVAMAGLVLALAPAAAAQDRTVTATGTGQVKVTPADRDSNDSIAAAADKAYAAALPKAIADGREDAQALAAASGLTLGELLSVSDAPVAPYYGPFGAGAPLGTFGPGKFCGKIRQPVVKRTKSGARKIVGHRTRRTCRVPPFELRQITMTFAIQ